MILTLILTTLISSCTSYIPVKLPLPEPIPIGKRVTHAELASLPKEVKKKIILLDKRRRTLRDTIEVNNGNSYTK